MIITINNREFSISSAKNYRNYRNRYALKRIAPMDNDAINYIRRIRVPIKMPLLNKRFEILDWLEDNIEGYYAYLSTNEICFTELIDAMAFKLRWI